MMSALSKALGHVKMHFQFLNVQNRMYNSTYTDSNFVIVYSLFRLACHLAQVDLAALPVPKTVNEIPNIWSTFKTY